MFYLIRTPWWLKKLYPSGIWSGPDRGSIYLTFDDGPHPKVTPMVLEVLSNFSAKGTFFCIGKNVAENREIYSCILDQGHRVGNHTQNHLNGWKTDDRLYLNDIIEAGKYIDSDLFRPPYGRITNFQMKQLQAPRFGMKCIMWSLLSGDFDPDVTAEICLRKLLLSVKGGDIVVFHDSEKAYEKLEFVLPRFLDHCTEKGWSFNIIN